MAIVPCSHSERGSCNTEAIMTQLRDTLAAEREDEVALQTGGFNLIHEEPVSPSSETTTPPWSLLRDIFNNMRTRSFRPPPLKLHLDTSRLSMFNMNSPVARINSPMAAHFRGKLTSQMRRVLPAYLMVIFLLIFFTNTGFFTAPIRAAGKYKRELKYARPTQSVTTIIPPKIWQTWKINPIEFEERDASVAKTWIEQNPTHRYEVLTDANDMAYVEWHFGPHGFNRPDIVELYRDVGITIVKADLLRYLIMYAEGGVYADIDVECIRPLHRFIPERYAPEDVDLIIGVEIDEPDYADHPILGPKSKSFCQWTFAAKPQQPVMMRLVENIKEWLHGLSHERGVPIAELELDFDDIITGTGPSAFTDAMLAQMEVNMRGKEITWDSFHDLADSKLVGGILVLNVEAFAAGQGHSDSGNHGSRQALVKHHYHASGWPKKHPRVNHPMYGEVEHCNWERACVDEWDKNVAEWNLLTKEEQEVRLATLETEKPPP